MDDDRGGERDKHGMTAADWKAFDAKTDEEIAADVAADPDAATSVAASGVSAWATLDMQRVPQRP